MPSWPSQKQIQSLPNLFLSYNNNNNNNNNNNVINLRYIERDMANAYIIRTNQLKRIGKPSRR